MSDGLPHIVLLLASVFLAVATLLFVMAWLEPRPQPARRRTPSPSALRVRLARALTRASEAPVAVLPDGQEPATLPATP